VPDPAPGGPIGNDRGRIVALSSPTRERERYVQFSDDATSVAVDQCMR